MPEVKTCVRCRVSKPVSDFERDKRQRSGLFSWCKACTRTAYQERKNARKDRGVTVDFKTCTACDTRKPASEFNKNWGHSTGLQRHCKDCQRVAKMLSKYGLTIERYRDMVARQGGACAICERAFIDAPQVDNYHTCCPGEKSCGQCVRGLVCGSCNRAIGLMGDSPDRLIAAAMYLLERCATEAQTVAGSTTRRTQEV